MAHASRNRAHSIARRREMESAVAAARNGVLPKRYTQRARGGGGWCELNKNVVLLRKTSSECQQKKVGTG